MDAKREQAALLPLIRSKVRDSLTASPAYSQMPKERRLEIAHNTVKALHYILGGENGDSIPTSMLLGGNSAAFAPSGALAGAGASPPKGGYQPPGGGAAGGSGGGDKKPDLGIAANEGGQAMSSLVADINFPAFVGGLIDGVFNSIVTTSIKQMEAYAEMVANVSKSVDQYMKDNVTENQARDYLVDKYPNHLELDLSGEKPQVKPKEGYDENSMPDFFADLGMKAPVSSLDEDNVEQDLVPAARRRIAMDRQQLLATMVMMGVNRLVVTNGTIEASCMFELDTTDTRKRSRTAASDYERTRDYKSESGQDGSYNRNRKYGFDWENKDGDNKASANYSDSSDYKQNWYSKSSYSDTAKFKMSTVSSVSDENTIQMHAQLGGKVKVNFKSDYFPMEKMVDVLQINQIKEKTAAGVAPQPQSQPLPPPPPPPPMPALPNVPAPAASAPAR